MTINISNFAADQNGGLGGTSSSGLVSVKSFGAAGDGVTDDTAAINQALSSITVAGGRLYFPAGIYIVSSTIVVPGSVQLMGTSIDYMSLLGSIGGTPVQGSVIRAAATFSSSSPMVKFGTILYPNANWYTDQNTGMNAMWMIFDANSAAQSAVQTFGTRARLLYCEMRNGLSYALDASGQNSQFIGCITDNNNVGTSVRINANDVKYLNGEVRSGSSAHITITGTTGNTMIDNNDIYGSANCPAILFNVTTSTTLGRISNNHINPTTNNGVQIVVSANQTMSGGVIVANKFYGNSSGQAGAGFALYCDVTAASAVIDGLVFSENHIADRSNGTRSGNGWSGFIGRKSSTGTINNLVAIGNVGNGVNAFTGGTPTLAYQHGNVWSNNTGTLLKSSQEGSVSLSGDGTTTAFTVTHSIGTAPSQVIITPTSAAAVGAYVSAKAAANFTITFATAPASGANNVTFDWLAKF